MGRGHSAVTIDNGRVRIARAPQGAARKCPGVRIPPIVSLARVMTERVNLFGFAAPATVVTRGSCPVSRCRAFLVRMDSCGGGKWEKTNAAICYYCDAITPGG